jgi:hypothetical protein
VNTFDSVAAHLEAACTWLDNHLPSSRLLMGWARCPNGWFARAALWLDGTTRNP